jgi:uncharacterized protein
MGPRSAEIIIVREGLKFGRFPDRQTSALRLVIVNEVVTVFRDVAGDCCRRPICHLNTEPVIKVPFAQGVLGVFVVRIKLGREIIQLGRTKVNTRIAGGEEVPMKIRRHVLTAWMVACRPVKIEIQDGAAGPLFCRHVERAVKDVPLPDGGNHRARKGECAMVAERIRIDRERLADFCRHNYIRKLALFGSILRDDFQPESDVDVLVEFEAGHVPGLKFFALERELSQLLGRKVDLNTPNFLSPQFRGRVLAEAEVQYVAP